MRLQRLAAFVAVEILDETVGRALEHLRLRAARQVHGDMRVVEFPQGMVGGQRFGRGDVEEGSADRLVPERGDQRVLVDHAAAGDVDQVAVGSQRIQHGTIHQIAGAVAAGREDLLDNNPVMRWSIRVRDPYTDPLHLLQAELMARLRDRDSDPVLESALMVTIAGIAAGLRNTG